VRGRGGRQHYDAVAEYKTFCDNPAPLCQERNMQKGKLRHCATALVTVILLCGTLAHADPPTPPHFTEQWHDILNVTSAASGRFALADVDGDGLPDIVFTGTAGYSYSSALFVLGQQSNDNIGLKQATVLPDTTSIRRVLTASPGGVAHVYTVAEDGTVRDFAGWPLLQQRQFSIAANVTAAAVGDLYGTGGIDLVVLTQDHLHAYDLASGSPLWNYAVSGASDIALAQLDSDPALEIILATTPGLVIDGATQATDWTYIDGFGGYLATGPLVAGGGTQWVGASAWNQFTVFRASPWSPLWSANVFNISAIGTADLDHNGQDVILEGDGQWGAVHVYDPNTQQERFNIPNPGWGVNAVVAADLDGDGVPEIAFAATEGYGAASIEVVDSMSGQVKWSFTSQDGVFAPTALGDVDGDGREEFVVAANTGNVAGQVEIFDASSGALKWQSPAFIGNANDPFYISTSRILLVPHATDNAMDIVFAGSSTYSGRITVMDGATHNVKLQIGAYSSGPMPDRYLVDAALVDFDNDGVLDYVAATEPADTGASGAQLYVFSGKDGHTLWTSVAMGSGFSNIVSVLVTGPATDPASELIAVLPDSLRAYNIQTHLLDWTLLATTDGATFVPLGASSPEIALFQHNGALSFYNATTHAYLRGLALSAPLNAVLPLDGKVDHLLLASGEALSVVNGVDGSVLAETDVLGQGLGLGNQLAATKHGPNLWGVGSGNAFGVFIHEFELSDQLFSDGFGN
jgi:hypothetical protein